MMKKIFLILLLMLSACTPFSAPKIATVKTYVLETPFNRVQNTPPIPFTLFVNGVRAAPGFDSPQIVYVNQQYERNFYAYNQWIDVPARMVHSLIVQALTKTSGFAAIVQAPSTLATDLRLDIELIRLQHEFTSNPSHVRLTIGVQLIDMKERKIIDTREFDVVENAPSENPYGGVVAANLALHKVLEQIVEFCVKGSGKLKVYRKSD